jgi:uncharacterized protein
MWAEVRKGHQEKIMTPQERKLIDELFDRLASLERNPRDPDAVSAINEGLQQAPNALYPLVQTALVQDEALKRADARIRELEQELDLEPGEPAKQPGFLDNMRDALTGRPQGSVPSVRRDAPSGPWRTTTVQQPGGGSGGAPQAPGQGYGQAPMQAPMSSGGSFLGTAAASAAGVVGGALLMNSFRGMFGGGQQGGGQGGGNRAFDQGGGGSPWSPGAGGGSGDLSRQAGIEDIGSGGRSAALDETGGSQRQGMFDVAQNDASADDDSDTEDDGDFDGDSGDTDTA